jgi:hypothetical protein
MFLAFHFTNSSYTLFIKEQRLHSILKALKISTKKIHLFLLPYLIMAISLFALIAGISFLTSNILIVLSLLIVCMAFLRYYISTLVLEIEARYDQS